MSAAPPEVTSGKPRLLHSVRHAAEALDLGPSTVWKLISDGKLETVRIGRSRRITDRSLRQFAGDEK
jgi:excisionase family DNA binding protein